MIPRYFAIPVFHTSLIPAFPRGAALSVMWTHQSTVGAVTSCLVTDRRSIVRW